MSAPDCEAFHSWRYIVIKSNIEFGYVTKGRSLVRRSSPSIPAAVIEHENRSRSWHGHLLCNRFHGLSRRDFRADRLVEAFRSALCHRHGSRCRSDARGGHYLARRWWLGDATVLSQPGHWLLAFGLAAVLANVAAAAAYYGSWHSQPIHPNQNFWIPFRQASARLTRESSTRPSAGASRARLPWCCASRPFTGYVGLVGFLSNFILVCRIHVCWKHRRIC